MIVKKQISKKKSMILTIAIIAMFIASFIIIYNTFIKKPSFQTVDFSTYQPTPEGQTPMVETPLAEPSQETPSPTIETPKNSALSLFGASTYRYYGEPKEPEITDISPGSDSVKGGATITVTGSNFGRYQGKGFVEFDTAKVVTYYDWSDSAIIVAAPSYDKKMGTATTTDIIVETDNGLKSVKTSSFKYSSASIRPEIFSISPVSGSIEGGADKITIKGKNFGKTQGKGLVSFNNVPAASIDSWSDESIVVSAPKHAEGNISLVVVNDAGQSSKDDPLSSAFKGLQSYVPLPIKYDLSKVGNPDPFYVPEEEPVE